MATAFRAGMDLDDTTQTVGDGTAKGRIGDLLQKISEDVRTIAHDEVELVREEVKHSAKLAITDASVALFGAIVALIGFTMLCVAAVAALSIVLPVWASLLIMAGVYLIFGGIFAAAFASKMKSTKPDLGLPTYEAKHTFQGAKSALTH